MISTGSMAAGKSETEIRVSRDFFAFAQSGVTVTEAGAPVVQGTRLASYVESSGPAAEDSLNSGIAIANTTDQTIWVSLRLATDAGMPFGQSITISLPARAQVAKFLSDLFPTLELPFRGVLHIYSQAIVSVMGLRGRYNARSEFIVATVSPVLSDATSASELYMPHLVLGGGYSTRLFFINSGGLSSTGNINFFTTDGRAADVPIR